MNTPVALAKMLHHKTAELRNFKIDFRISGTAQETNQLAGAGRRHGGTVSIDRIILKVKDQTGGLEVDWRL
jgi:hypothetical protein